MTNWKDLIRKAEVELKHEKVIGEILLTNGIIPDSFMSWTYSTEFDRFMIQYAKMFVAKYGKDALPDDSPFLDEV